MPSLLAQFLTVDFRARLRGLPMTTAATGSIPLTPVQSSNLAAIGYDAEARELRVQFQSGHIYSYVEVPPETWAQFQAADSKGRFYGLSIKGKYPTEKVTGACKNCGDIGLTGAQCTDCGCATYASAARSDSRR